MLPQRSGCVSRLWGSMLKPAPPKLRCLPTTVLIRYMSPTTSSHRPSTTRWLRLSWSPTRWNWPMRSIAKSRPATPTPAMPSVSPKRCAAPSPELCLLTISPQEFPWSTPMRQSILKCRQSMQHRWQRKSATPEPFSSAPIRLCHWETMRPGRITCCPRPAVPAILRGYQCRPFCVESRSSNTTRQRLKT